MRVRSPVRKSKKEVDYTVRFCANKAPLRKVSTKRRIDSYAYKVDCAKFGSTIHHIVQGFLVTQQHLASKGAQYGMGRRLYLPVC